MCMAWSANESLLDPGQVIHWTALCVSRLTIVLMEWKGQIRRVLCRRTQEPKSKRVSYIISGVIQGVHAGSRYLYSQLERQWGHSEKDSQMILCMYGWVFGAWLRSTVKDIASASDVRRRPRWYNRTFHYFHSPVSWASVHVKDGRCLLVEQILHDYTTQPFVVPSPTTSQCCIITIIVVASTLQHWKFHRMRVYQFTGRRHGHWYQPV